MKFFVSALIVFSPLLAAQVSALAVPEHDFLARQNGGQRGQRGKGFGGGKGNQGGNGAKTTVAAATSTSSAAAASTGAAGAGGVQNSTVNAVNTGDPQTSLTLDPAVIAKGFANDGQSTPAAGQVASLTSTNNFINFCLTTNQPLTNGQQITTGSCNPAPMGSIPGITAMPSSKFTNPKNFQDIPANQAFTITMAIQNMETGNFVNAQQNYFSAPQQLNAQGQIRGHSHVVVELLTAIDQTTPNDPNKFAFFKGLNAAASGGILSADVTSGLPAGVYKLSSINTAANHQPVIVPIAQHGSLDDAIYFTVGGAGGGAAAGTGNGGNNGGGAANATTTGTPTATGATASASAANKGGAASGGKKGAGGKGKGRRSGPN